MKKSNSVLMFICAGLILFGGYGVSAQFEDRTEKKALVNEIRELTGMKSLSAKTELNSTNIGDALLNLIEKEKDLTDEQRKELKQSTLEGKERLEKQVRDFTTDTSVTNQMFEDVFFDLYDRNFTLVELRDMVAFYRTESGQKAARFSWRVLSEFNKEFSDSYAKKLKEFMTIKLEEELELLRHKIKDVRNKNKSKT